MKWWARSRGEQQPNIGCPLCGQLMTLCPSCSGRYDPGGITQICQVCSLGMVCPRCQQFWTTS